MLATRDLHLEWELLGLFSFYPVVVTESEYALGRLTLEQKIIVSITCFIVRIRVQVM